MQRSDLPKYYSDNVGLIHAVAKKGYARLMQIGAAYPYEDLRQELSVVFIKAFDAFDDTCGAKFSTYFTVSAYNQINKIVGAITIERMELKMRSVQEMASWHSDDIGDELELVVSDSLTPSQQYEASKSVEEMMSSLSPLASKVVTLAIDPPPFMEHELNASLAHAKRARDGGENKRGKGSMNVSFVCGFLEKVKFATPIELRMARQEITAAAERSLL